MNGWLLFSIAIIYLGLLFYIAFASDRGRIQLGKPSRALAYALSLGVYCTSWTFFGAVGTTVQSGWAFLPIYLGPILVFVLLARPIRRIIRITRQERLTSIADFLAARYGRSRAIAVVATLISLLAVVPYLSLQLKAIDASFTTLAPLELPAGLDQAFIIALVMAGFAVLFGARHVSSVHRQHGLVNAVAFESVIKLIAIAAVGAMGLWLIGTSPQIQWQDIAKLSDKSAPPAEQFGLSFWVTTLLAGCAFLCLPRQFHLGFVEAPDESAYGTARWLLPLYLLGSTLFIVPIAITGTQVLAPNIDPDTYVLALPLSQNSQMISVLAYLGGLSASSAMVIVSTVALSIMISNELVVPFLLRNRLVTRRQSQRMDVLILRTRRVVILVTVIFGYLFYRLYGSGGQLAAYGLISFVAIAQLAPALLAAVLWRSARANAVLTSLLVGICTWAYTILLPATLPADSLWLSAGPLGMEWLRPQALFGTGTASPLTHGALWSLGLNLGSLILLSITGQQRFSERAQAEIFLGDATGEPQPETRADNPLSVRDVELLLERFVGQAQAEASLLRYEQLHPHSSFVRSSKAPPSLLQHAERELVGAIGSSTTKIVLARSQSREGLGISDVANIVSQAAEDIRFSRTLLSATLENIDQGVSVVNEDLKLVAWNQRYIELFEYPPGLIQIGTPIESIIRHNAERGLCGEGEIEAHVQRRIAHMRSGSTHQFERIRPDGTVIEMRGRPMPDGGFVTSFSDITEHKRIQEELQRINESLEKIVEQRTSELAEARDAAQLANASKTQYLRAASHDLLQPLSAARLMTSALLERLPENGDRDTVTHIEHALTSAEEMIANLSEINRLDAKHIPVRTEPLNLQSIFDSLLSEFSSQFAKKGLTLRFRPTKLAVVSDAHMLRRILQNLIVNASRYTESGRVVVGVRHRGENAEIQVLDTGCGIPEDKRKAIFNDFTRLKPQNEDKGQGLGLGIVRRMASLLGHKITLHSVLGRGSRLGLVVPRALGLPGNTATISRQTNNFPDGVCVLCLDNDPAILQGLEELLEGWGLNVITAENRHDLLRFDKAPDVAIVDYRLDNETGIQLMTAASAQWGTKPAMILATAERTDEVEKAAQDEGMLLLHKPLKPASLRAALTRLIKKGTGSTN